MSEPQTAMGASGRRTRFARLYSDGSMGLEPAGSDFFEARRRLIDSHADDDVELLEVELVVVRSLGQPKLRAVTEHHISCPTCGEEITFEAEAVTDGR